MLTAEAVIFSFCLKVEVGNFQILAPLDIGYYLPHTDLLLNSSEQLLSFSQPKVSFPTLAFEVPPLLIY